MELKLSFSTILLDKSQNPFEILLIQKIKDQVTYNTENIENAAFLNRYKNKSWDVIADLFQNKVFYKWTRSIREKHSLLGIEIPLNQYTFNKIMEYTHEAFLNAAQEGDFKLYIKHTFESGIKHYPSTITKEPLDISFEIIKNEQSGLEIVPKFSFDGTEIENFVHYEFLIFSKNFTFILPKRTFQLFQWMEKKNWQQYQYDPIALSNEILSEIEKQYVVNRNDLFPKETIDTLPQNQLLLKESAGFLMMYPRWSYEGIIVEGRFEDETHTIRQGTKYTIYRKESEEKTFIELLKNSNPEFGKQINGYFFLSIENAKKKNWFLKFYHQLLEQQIEILGMDMLSNFRYSSHAVSTQLEIIKNEGNTLLIKCDTYFGEELINNIELQKNLKARQRNILLSDNTIGVLEDQWIEKYALLVKHSKIQDNILEVPRWIMLFQKSAFDNLDIDSLKIETNWWELWEKWQHDDAVLFPIDHSIKASLRPYQQKGFEWMYLLSKIGAGACLADDMGLGKTLQTICLLQTKINENPDRKHIIIGPASLIYNWKVEIEKFAPNLKAEVYHSSNRNLEEIGKKNPDVLITSYGTARVDIDILNEIQWNTIVLDESHNIKNHQAQVSKAVLTLKADMRVILSGTPIMNETLDLYPQLSFILPQLFGSREFFNKEYAYPIDKDRDVEKIEALKRTTAPFILRRTKEQVAKDLPPKTESIIWCDMGEQQMKLYSEIKNNVKKSIFLDIQEQGIGKAKLGILAAITRLRQVCSAPKLLQDYENATEDSIKIERLLDEINGNLKNEKIIVFSQFLNALDIIKTELSKNQIAYYCIDGSTPNTKRQEQINQFQDPENKVRIFLLSLKAGNAGITLTQANYVFLLDPWWNRQVEQQAIDRVYRIGQDKNVFAYRMICRNTIEERIIQLQQNKMKLSEDLITEDEGFVKNLSESDLAFLFD